MKKIITHRKINKDISTLDQLVSILEIDKIIFSKILRTAPLLYKQIALSKKDGSYRNINAPRPDLKLIQRLILDKVFSGIKLPPCVYGLSKNRSIIENAKYHSRSDYLLNLDIKNFFPSVHFEKVKQIFQDIGLGKISSDLCKLTTLNYELPQGTPTSPFLASLALNNLDYRLTKLAESNHLLYTRYFDDICFSGDRRIKALEESIKGIIKEEGYRVKTSKRQLFEKGAVKEINGILITEGKLSLKSTADLFAYLNELKSEGLSQLKSDNPEKECHSLRGKISFLKQIDRKMASRMENVFCLIKW
ncbi:MAG: reverse transcriptase family protein [Patescibacteria group bacterium]|nr:reverse transcriptase family protein [Patescibacteria group bacterium]